MLFAPPPLPFLRLGDSRAEQPIQISSVPAKAGREKGREGTRYGTIRKREQMRGSRCARAAAALAALAWTGAGAIRAVAAFAPAAPRVRAGRTGRPAGAASSSPPSPSSYSSSSTSSSSSSYSSYSSFSAALASSTAPEQAPEQASDPPDPPASLPSLLEHGIYEIVTREEHAALLAAHPDHLVVVKFYAGYCRACKLLEPKYVQLRNDPQLTRLPVIWAQFKASRDNRDFFRSVGILSLPTVHFYEGSVGLVENFPCGPAKISVLKAKLATFLNSRVDPATLSVRRPLVLKEGAELASDGPRQNAGICSEDGENCALVTPDHVENLRSLTFFADLTEDEFDVMLHKARLQTFDAGDVIARQGAPGRAFYVLKSGLVEMCIRRKHCSYPTAPTYLGSVVSDLGCSDYFGERALTTGEPYAASFKVLERARCFVFRAEDIPESSILSRKRSATRETIEKLNQRYELPEDYMMAQFAVPHSEEGAAAGGGGDESILELLVRFKQIRQAAKCFEYIMKTDPNWGDGGEIARRSLLVSKLTRAQRDEFTEVFAIADINGDERLSLLEMRIFMQSARTAKTDAEILEMINKANPATDGKHGGSMSLEEFLGVMAEAEFYSLLTETFRALDEEDTGYVRAGDLNDVLGGVRDIMNVHRDQHSIIDVDDQDVQIDYEQFSKMLLGAEL